MAVDNVQPRPFSDGYVTRDTTTKRGLVIVDTTNSEDKDNKCDLVLDLVPYTGPMVFEKGEKEAVITIEIKRDDIAEETEFFNMRLGSIHKRVKRGPQKWVIAAFAVSSGSSGKYIQGRMNIHTYISLFHFSDGGVLKINLLGAVHK